MSVTASSAYRAKYRRKVSLKHHIATLGTHRKNRGGVYPAGLRCKALTVDALEGGFSKEDFAHLLVAVEEVPAEQLCPPPENYQSGAAYNKEQSEKDEYLCTCFAPPYGDVRLQLLAHNHMMLVLRAFLVQAKWDLPYDAERNIVYCDGDGQLSATAVAGSPNGKELAEILEEGVVVEVLAWEMDVEEPMAAGIISRALQKTHELTLRTTELTALAHLKGEIIVQMGKDLSQRVAFASVRDKVRMQLDSAADDPDLPELFDFLINAGVGHNTYLQDFQDFSGVFVDSTKRQLRLSAFAVANKIAEKAPLTKIAVMKRAYRKKPSVGFCPNPEAAWGTFTMETLGPLEELLRWFHSSCKASLDALPPQSRIKVLGNTDVVAADTFLVSMAEADKKRLAATARCAYVRKALLGATAKYLEALGLSPETAPSCTESAPWISFAEAAAVAEPSAAKLTASPEADASVNVLTFDEGTGQQLKQQVDFPAAVAAKELVVEYELPWKDWHRENRTMGNKEADKASAVAVLHGLHELYDVTTNKVKVVSKDGSGLFVVATEAIPKNGVLLPPCVPRQCKVQDIVDHPSAARIKVQTLEAPTRRISKDAQKVSREHDFVALPEFKAPAPAVQKTPTAVAGGEPQSSEPPSSEPLPSELQSSELQWLWGQGRAETMHPFWAVRRLTTQQLDKEVETCLKRNKTAVADMQERIPRFNCALRDYNQSLTTIASLGDTVLNSTKLVRVPMLTNTDALDAGEELILHHVVKAKEKEPSKRTWREVNKGEPRTPVRAKQHKPLRSNYCDVVGHG